jgi:hypothetical protein
LRITNDDYTPLSLLTEVLAYAPASVEQTERFAGTELSSHDYILKALRLRFEAILNSFKRLGSNACETQGLNDKGIDLLLEFEHDKESQRIGFQIKSNREADADAKRNSTDPNADPELGLLKTLKRQAMEALLSDEVNEWWILPCFDLTQHSKRLGAINSYFNLNSRESWPMKVIAPEKILGLLSLSTAKVEAVCIKFLCHKDEVLVAAQRELKTIAPSAKHRL